MADKKEESDFRSTCSVKPAALAVRRPLSFPKKVKNLAIMEKYQAVAEWNSEHTDNRSRVVAHWLEMIVPYSQASLDEQYVSNVPCQFIHRTASACHDNPQTAYVVYQIFYDSSIESKMAQFIDILRESAKQLHPTHRLRFAVNAIATTWEDLTVSQENVLQEIKTKDVCSFGAYDWQWLDQ